MPYASTERRRQVKREWSRARSQRHPSWIPDYAEGGNEQWLIVTCAGCLSFFDIPRRPGRRPRQLCPDCR
jgi:hypothetical protein